MKIKLFVFLLIMAWILTSCGYNQMKKDLSIRAVAGQFVDELYQDNQLELFVFSLPGQAVVPDHQTGPRLIIFLTDLKANRLDNGDEIEANKNQVVYLVNEFSKGFVNSANEAAYLVLGLKQSVLHEGQAHACGHEGLEQLFAQGDLVVCRSRKSQSVKLAVPTLSFTPETSQLVRNEAGAETHLYQNDLVIKLHGIYQ
jgi:hypothetical protein